MIRCGYEATGGMSGAAGFEQSLRQGQLLVFWTAWRTVERWATPIGSNWDAYRSIVWRMGPGKDWKPDRTDLRF